jgi:hypothetical protein
LDYCKKPDYLLKKPSILLLVSALLLSGCASTTLNSKKVDHADIKPATPTQAAALPSQENIPNVELTDEIFFGIESSEIAFQRGQFILAFNTMMTLAEQTRDPRLAKRALEMALLVKEAQPAKEAAQLWHDISPNSDEATQYYWGFLVLEEDWATLKTSAAERLAQASKEERSLTLMRLQRLLARAKDKQAAWTVLETLCQPYLDTLEAHIVLSQA